MDSVKFSRRLRRVTSSAFFVALALAAVNASLSQEDASAQAQAPAPAAAQAQAQAQANDAAAEIDAFIADVADLSARFVETIYDPDGVLEDSSEGRFLLLRPDRFIWHYESPFEYEVVADGETLWTWDVELEQITRRPQSELEATPATLLSGESGVGDRYEVSDATPDDVQLALDADVHWISLVPSGDGGDFLSARIAFSDGAPVALELVDGLGQLTTVRFFDIEINSGLDPAEFAFVPPPGIDVAGDD
jgi:outer membrane lipoprotein carrier protein